MNLQAVAASSALFLASLVLLQAEEILPTEDQIDLKRGHLELADGIRSVTGEADATGHGPITDYQIPFAEGAVSLSWKVDAEQSVSLVLDGPERGKASHSLKVIFNGGHGKDRGPEVLTLVTYDGSTPQKKKAKVVRHEHHAEPGEWHEVSVRIEGERATVVVDGETFTATSEKLRQGISKFGIGHSKETLQTKGVKIDKAK